MVRRGYEGWRAVAIAMLVCACADAPGEPGSGTGSSGAAGSDAPATTLMPAESDAGSSTVPPSDSSGSPMDTGAATTGDDDGSTGDPVPESEPLQIKFLGVGGVAVRYLGETWISAPLYSNPDFFATTFGDVASDPALIDQFLPLEWIEPAKAILVGHAHYDHLMDVPYVWTHTDDAYVYGNDSMGLLMGAAPEVPSDRIVVLNDPADPLVDRRTCPEPDQCTGIPSGNEGAWVDVPGLAVRLRAICSSHPAQFLGIVHFGEGCMVGPVETLPTAAGEWLEGATLAYLVDMLDPRTGATVFRIYYQDTPTVAPVGHPDASLLGDKRVDVAIINVGSYTAVEAHPEEILATLDPRYVIAIHWENFFIPQSMPPEQIPFQPDPSEFDMRALASISDESQPPMVIDGNPERVRYVRPNPGTEIDVFAGR